MSNVYLLPKILYRSQAEGHLKEAKKKKITFLCSKQSSTTNHNSNISTISFRNLEYSDHHLNDQREVKITVIFNKHVMLLKYEAAEAKRANGIMQSTSSGKL
jgi:hypothetical protein